jgi:pyruvate/2-oxoglutarate dehydrogenase complex dihydrolipoamide dehydrogenase (E3) component
MGTWSCMTAKNVFDIAVIGGGSASEALLRSLEGSGMSVVMFEPKLVGGECPFVACMPSKSMLHDAGQNRTWAQGVARRAEVVSGLDDAEHRREARELGATIVSSSATIVDELTVSAAGVHYSVDHIVIATGAVAVMPEIDGLDKLGDRLWASEDALTAIDRPDRLVIVGGGVIGSEIAQIFSQLGSNVTVVDPSERPADDLHPRVGELIAESLIASGVDLRYRTEPSSIEVSGVDGPATVVLNDGSRLAADKVLVAVGRRPNTLHLGLAELGLDPDNLDVADSGRVTGPGSIWIMGDAAGQEQYTHIANRHAAVIANRIAGNASRAFGESVVPACIFITPPVIVIGPTWSDLEGDDDVVWATVDLDVPRMLTDELPDGFLAVAARQSTNTVVAAHGIGPRFDELCHALVIAIDGAVPIETLERTIQPFPTVGEILGTAFARLADQLQ